MKCYSFSCDQLFAAPRTVAHRASLSMEFPRQEYRRGWSFPSAGYLPDTGIKLRSLALQADSLPLNHQGSPSPRLKGFQSLKDFGTFEAFK